MTFWRLLGSALALAWLVSAAAQAEVPAFAQDPHVKFKKSAPAWVAGPSPADSADDADAAFCAGWFDYKPGRPPQAFLPLDAGETLDVSAPKGDFKLVVEPSGAAAIAAIDARRRKAFDRDFDLAQARMLRCSQGASQVVLVTADGQLLGAHKTTRSYAQPYQIWSFDLNETGRTQKVVLTKGRLGEATGLCVRWFDKDGVEFFRALLEALDVHEEKNPDGNKAFESVCGAPASS